MKKIILILTIITCLIGIGYYIYNNISFVDNLVEVPIEQPEINEDIVGNINIYLINLNTNEIEKESRNISLKELNASPYNTILKELKTPSNSSNILSPIPNNCEIISVTNNKNILEITLSKEFLEQDIQNAKDKLILKSIIFTINNLKEIEGIKISVSNTNSILFGNYSLDKIYTINDFKE